VVPEEKTLDAPYDNTIDAVEVLDVHTVTFVFKYATRTLLPGMAANYVRAGPHAKACSGREPHKPSIPPLPDRRVAPTNLGDGKPQLKRPDARRQGYICQRLVTVFLNADVNPNRMQAFCS
jgi:hypothetical protein